MTYKRFEETPAWQAAQRVFVDVCRLVSRRDFPRRGDLVNQLERAALSIANNIAEGFERGTTSELLTFLYIARGSAAEVRSCLLSAEALCQAGVAAMGDETLQLLEHLLQATEGISRQLRGWAQSLQDSDIAGQRKLTQETRQEYGKTKRATAFRQQLEIARDEAVNRWQQQT